ncbi:MAG: diacylglycerol/lipid kinase family protein [Actinomycetota bacterium]
MTRSFAFLVNPAADGGAGPRAVVPVARLLRDAGADVDVTYSPGPEAGRALAAEAVGRGAVVVACGGDGMVASLAGAVVEAGGVLGIVPTGRGNDFARMLGIGGGPAGVAATLLGAEPRAVDVIDVDGRVVVGSVYAGVDSLASAFVDRAHRLPRPVQYPYAAVRAVVAFRPLAYEVVVDGVPHRFEAETVVVANSGYYGSGMRIAPGAAVDDGALDVVVIGAMARRRLIRNLPRLYDGTHVRLSEVTVLRGREIRVAAAASVPAYGDGERLGELPVVARVRPGALRLLA